MITELAQLVRDRRVVLFAGAGLSAPLGLPTWSELIAHMAQDLGYDPAVLVQPGVNYLTVAEYYVLEKNIGPLRSWMDRKWLVDDAALSASKVHNQIVDLDFPFIYTTNYDRNIERAFELRGRQFDKIASVVDIGRASSDRPHIVKFHGDFDNDGSIVLAESRYFERLRFEHPLDIKFRADVLGRSILFVGYSLNDLNMRLLLYSLQQTWKEAGALEHRPKSYMVMLRPDPIQQRVLESWGVETIVPDVDSPELGLPHLFDQLLAGASGA